MTNRSDVEPAISDHGPLTEASVVMTPEGAGSVVVVHEAGAVALIRTAEGLRPWAFRELTHVDGSPVCAVGSEARAADQGARLTAARSLEGIGLRGGYRLAELDLTAGHGRIYDADGTQVAYVRARIGDDGRRYWWLQSASGGAPYESAYPEHARSDQPHPAVRAANWAYWYLRSTVEAGPVAAERARRSVTLTLARVRELRALPLPVSPITGAIVRAPDWRDRWRRYELSVDQMNSLAAAARTALSTTPGDTAEHRRRRRVLTAAAEQLEFHAYDTARAHATVASPGTPDSYDHPYAAPAPAAAIIDLDITEGREPNALFHLPTATVSESETSPAQDISLLGGEKIADGRAERSGPTDSDAVRRVLLASESSATGERRAWGRSPRSGCAVGDATTRAREPRPERAHPRSARTANSAVPLPRTSPARGRVPPRLHAVGDSRTVASRRPFRWEDPDRGTDSPSIPMRPVRPHPRFRRTPRSYSSTAGESDRARRGCRTAVTDATLELARLVDASGLPRGPCRWKSRPISTRHGGGGESSSPGLAAVFHPLAVQGRAPVTCIPSGDQAQPEVAEFLCPDCCIRVAPPAGGASAARPGSMRGSSGVTPASNVSGVGC